MGEPLPTPTNGATVRHQLVKFVKGRITRISKFLECLNADDPKANSESASMCSLDNLTEVFQSTGDATGDKYQVDQECATARRDSYLVIAERHPIDRSVK
ncbi:hypothetical protein TNCV_3294931 [Trichonephila clavipes]|uniref:Uncharacterized protein n=1 Tax=Trichonephila clavipes TaxID=2585209 RepID=A0A8X6VT21_TRICX|nr:hypothetical protein TNCV_3294931 [Trichonephila clavipes]